MDFPLQIFFNDINYSYRAAILKKNVLWLLLFYVVVATCFYYEKLRRTMHTAIVSNLLKKLLLIFLSFHAMENLKYKLFLNSADQIKKLKNILLPNTLWEVNFVYRFDYCINVLLRFTRDMMDFLLILLI